MFCQKCRAELPDGSQFCSKCGAPIEYTLIGSCITPPKLASLTASTSEKTKSSGKLIGWLAILALIFLAYVGGRIFSSRQTTPHPRPVMEIQRPVPQAHTVTITNTAFTVKAASFSYFKFDVPPNAANVVVSGHFTATGGSGNDIELSLMNEDNFVNMQNGHEASVFYKSGRVTQSSMGVDLPSAPATYYLIFDNRFSLLTPKAVQVNATLTYMQ